jgi:vacuolar-type H+-ATPase catalytic subunit A/Vma1
MNATQLTNVLQKVKDDPVLQETLRVTKQDWAELNLTTQETFYCTNWTQCCDDFNDQELESSNGWTRQYTDCGGTCGAISRACCG